jgi:transcriptional antiterminator RfaH
MAVCSDENIWFLAQLKPNCAQIADRNLTQQGFKTFLPLEERTQQRNGRFKTTYQPLFPGYIFVAFDVTKGLWRQINSTYGINRLIGLGMKGPTEVPTAVVTQLMDRCDSTGKLLPPRILKAGDQVFMTTGPFANFLAEVERTTPDRRVWILMDLMGGKTQVSVAPENLRFA